MFDASGREVGDIIVLKDVTESLAYLRTLSVTMLVICVIVGATILVSFYLYIRHIENKLTSARRDLESEIKKRKEIEIELYKHRDHLEDPRPTSVAGDQLQFREVDGHFVQIGRVTSLHAHPTEEMG